MHDEAVMSTERLLAEVSWLRKLARRLVADEHLADDLAQDTLVAALEHSRGGRVASRAWLRRVLHNFLHQFARGAGHRRLREQYAARSEQVSAAETWLLEVEAQRELIEAVLALDEPCRSCVVLRYLRSMPPREIARELKLPVSTVSSRITAGVERLRARLAARRAGESDWIAALLPLVFMPTRSPLGLLGVIALNTKVVVTALALVVVGAWVAVVALRHDAAAAPTDATAAADRAERPRDFSGSSAGTAPAADDRRAVGAPTPLDHSTSGGGELAPLRRVHGRVFDVSGTPARGIALESNAGKGMPRIGEGFTSGVGGLFEFETRSPQAYVVSADAKLVTVRSGVSRSDSALEPIVIVASALDLAGEIVDREGNALNGASIGLDLPRDFESRFSASLEGTYNLSWHAIADERGHFALPRTPLIEGALLRAAADGYVPRDEPTPATSRDDLRIEMARPSTPLAGALAGVVLDNLGQRVAEARVALGLASVLSDAQGEFHIDLARAATTDTLRAIKPGFLPAVLERPFEPRAGDGGWPAFVEVRLPGPALDFTGRIVDELGAAVTGVRVSLADPTPFGVIGKMPATVEGLASGAPVPPQAIASQAQLPAEDGDNFNDMRMRPGPPSAFWNWVRTDAEGRFELGGLSDRSYRVRVLDDATLAAFTSDPIPAGARDVVITMPRAKVWERLAGRVVSNLGAPQRDVAITLEHEAYGARARVWGGRVEIMLVQPRETVRTDAEGRFEFKDVPREGVWLELSASEIVPTAFHFDDLKDERDLKIVVDVRCRIEVVLDPPFERADKVRLLDAEGREVDALIITEGSVTAITEIELIDGKSGVFSASSRAATLVLLLGDTPVARHAITLQPGEPNVLRY